MIIDWFFSSEKRKKIQNLTILTLTEKQKLKVWKKLLQAHLSSSHRKLHLPQHKHEEHPTTSSDRLIEMFLHKSEPS